MHDAETIEPFPICPRCGYALYGLSRPICPECGSHFDAALIVTWHPCLFYQQESANIRAFLKTFISGWQAAKFWSTIRTTQRLSLVRLAAYAAIVVLLYAIPITCALGKSACLHGMSAINIYKSQRAYLSNRLRDPKNAEESAAMLAKYGSAQACVDNVMPPLTFPRCIWIFAGELTRPPVVRVLCAAPIAWIVFTFVLLFVSPDNESVPWRHWIRTTVYATDAIAAAGALFAALLILRAHMSTNTSAVAFLITGVLLAMIAAHRLNVARRNYLRCRGGRVFAYMSQFMCLALVLGWASLVSVLR